MNAPGRRRGRAETSPAAADRRLRGRTYAIPFEDVWQSALRLAGGALRGWTVISSDDNAGVITAEARRFTGAMYDAVIEVRLDEDAQTRVDGRTAARKPGTDFGTSRRLLGRFFRALDRNLARRRQHEPVRRP